ncbi:MAG: phosphatase PAP2 family protein [Dehalococcoidia bacterium]
MNDALLDILNGKVAGHWDLLDDQALFWAQYGVFILALAAGALGLRDLKRSPARGASLALFVVGAGVLAFGILWLAGQLIVETRPFVHDRDTIQLLKHGADNSFPSDHATLAGLLAVVAALAWPKHAPWLLGIGFLVGLSRVVAGVHYPGDVLTGWLIGGGTAAVLWFAVRPTSRQVAWRPRRAAQG